MECYLKINILLEWRSRRKSTTAGRHGIPGTNSGNFCELANQVINGHLLTAEFIAGNGGRDGTGNVDDSCFMKFGRAKDYLVSFLKSESGIDDIETINVEDSSVLFLVLYANVNYRYKFRILPKCWGKTGLVGPGGIGGNSGYYRFIQTTVSADNWPSSIKQNGITGENGKNAVAFKTKALDVRTDR